MSTTVSVTKIALAVVLGYLFISSSVQAQASIADLPPAQRASLEHYLKTDPSLSFRSETILSEEYRKQLPEWFGNSFPINYAVGDFNRDKRPDFAVLLMRSGHASFMSEDHTVTEHNPDYPLTVVIFNGQSGGRYRAAFSRKVAGPAASFIRYDPAGKGSLYFGIFETDSDTIEFVPYGRKYTARFAGH